MLRIAPLAWLFTVAAFDPVFPTRRDSHGPFLYVGSHPDATNTDSLRLLRIKYILLIGRRDSGLQMLDIQRDHAIYEHVEAIEDLELPHFKQAWKFLNASMHKAVEEKMPGSTVAPANVLVVSARGCQRAGAVAASFIFRYAGIAPSEAVKHVKQHRPCFAPTQKLIDTLHKLDEVTKVTKTESIVDQLMRDVGRKVSSRSLSSQKLETCSPMHDTYWYYGDLSVEGAEYLTVPSTQQCCELCGRHPECMYWSYGLASEYKERCYLKTGDGAYMASRPHFVSGTSGSRRDEL